MPRTDRANRRKPDSETADGAEFAGWMEGEAAEQALRGICGCWCDKGGSKYRLQLDDATMKVRTTMVRGKTLISRGVIRIEWQGNHGRVVWCRAAAGVVLTIGKLEHTSLTWESDDSKPMRWDRLEKWNKNDQLETVTSHHLDEEESWDKWEDWQHTAVNAVQRRANLRREIQENRQQVIQQEKTKKQEGNYRNRSQKGMGSKNDAQEKQGDGRNHNFRNKNAFTGAKAKGEFLKSELKVNRQLDEVAYRTVEHKTDAEEHTSSHKMRDIGLTVSAADSMLRENHGLKHEIQTGTAGNRGGLRLSAPPPKIVGVTAMSSGSMAAHGFGQPQAGQEMKQGFGVGEGLLSKLCIGPTMVMDPSRCSTAADVTQQHNLREHSVHGPIVQPWVVPPSWAVGVGPDGSPPELQCVLSALEWYFSDGNLSCDLYLRSFMTPVEGWVPLMVLLTLSRMQAIGTDCVSLRQAASCSPMLELDSTGYYTRIRDLARRTCWLPTRHHG